jgi:hypothetical protein
MSYPKVTRGVDGERVRKCDIEGSGRRSRFLVKGEHPAIQSVRDEELAARHGNGTQRTFPKVLLIRAALFGGFVLRSVVNEDIAFGGCGSGKRRIFPIRG